MTDFQTYINRAPNVKLDKKTLAELSSIVAARNNVLLLGFNDTTKHLANMHSENVIAIQDTSISESMSYRGIPVTDLSVVEGCEHAVLCDFAGLYRYKSAVDNLYAGKVQFAFAGTYDGKSAKVVNFVKHDQVMGAIFDSAKEAPPTMMSERDLFQILQYLNHSSTIEGDVAEVGAWQGGSAWYIAKYLEITGSSKKLHVYEMGETLDHLNPQGIVCEDEMRQKLSFYPHTHCMFGSALTHLEALDGTPLSFVFLDFGYSESILEQLFSRMSKGAVIILDNYGHTLGHPDKFDAFFEQTGNVVVRFHGVPTGIVIKK